MPRRANQHLEVELDGADDVTQLLERVPQVRVRLREVGVDPDALLFYLFAHTTRTKTQKRTEHECKDQESGSFKRDAGFVVDAVVAAAIATNLHG